jgi:O-antigen/teichoic acid export membrane protein
VTGPAPETPAPLAPSLRDRLRRGISWNLVGSLATQGVTFGVNVIAANILGRKVFGAFGLLQVTYVAFSLLAAFAMGTVTTKYVAEFAATDPKRAGRILGLCEVFSLLSGLVTALLLAAGSGWVAESFLEAPELRRQLLIVAGAVFLGAFNSYQTGALAGLERFREMALANLASGAFYLALCGPAAWGLGLDGSATALLLYSLVQAILLRRTLRRQVHARGLSFRRDGARSELKLVLSFALPFALANLSLWPAQWLGGAILARTDDGLAQMGLFGAANSLRVFIVFLPFVATNFHWSILNQQKGLGEARRFRKVFWFNVALNALLVTVGAAAVAALGPMLLRLFGKDFSGSNPVLLILLLSTIPEALGIAFSLAPLCQGRIWLYLGVMVIPRDVTRVALAWYLCPRWGAVGLATAYAIGWGVGLVASLVLMGFLGLHPEGRRGEAIQPEAEGLAPNAPSRGLATPPDET